MMGDVSRKPTNFGSSAGPQTRRSPEGHAPSSMRFARVAEAMGEALRRRGLVTPAFRSPPRTVGLSRSIQRRSDGSAVVAVGLRCRPWPAVVADMIEGAVVVNDLSSGAAGRLRSELWVEIEAVDTQAA
jgi:hypothetical protein